MQEDLIFFPDSFFIGDPVAWDMPFDDVYFPTTDGLKLHGWFVPGEKEITLLWCHGNAGNISYRLDNMKLLHDSIGVGIFIFDYRGYGYSQGRPSEAGTYRDAEAALVYLHQRPDIDSDSIVIFGRSLGGAVAVDLASRHQCRGLILESTFTSLVDLFEIPYEFKEGSELHSGFSTIKYDSLAKIKKVEVPLLMFHGNCDEVVPFESGCSLYSAANEPKRFYVIEGAGHNDTYIIGGEEYLNAIREFIDSLSKT
jgi:fermentation-respiration switch protein FrsA (DUF1100 family)